LGNSIMANLKLKNPAGGSLNLVSADGASDLTVTFPAATGTAMVSGNMPAFSVYTNDGTSYFTNETQVKVRFNVELFDTNNNFDSTTNYRFTPTVAGYYSFSAKVLTNSGGAGGQQITYLHKNGSELAQLEQLYISQNGTGTTGSYLAYANGTTDYFEIYQFQSAGSSKPIYTTSTLTFWTGFLVKAA
jgi:hypothetical protein